MAIWVPYPPPDVLIWGDSNVQGLASTDVGGKSFPQLMKDRLGSKVGQVVNLGIGGQPLGGLGGTLDIIGRIPGGMANSFGKNVIAMVWGGTNDANGAFVSDDTLIAREQACFNLLRTKYGVTELWGFTFLPATDYPPYVPDWEVMRARVNARRLAEVKPMCRGYIRCDTNDGSGVTLPGDNVNPTIYWQSDGIAGHKCTHLNANGFPRLVDYTILPQMAPTYGW
jgi:hypothetical protein